DRYIFQLTFDSNFVQIEKEAVTELSKYSANDLLFDSTYYWRTRGFNAFGDSSKWSSVFSFGTTPGLIITPASLVDTINFSEGDSDTLKGIEFRNMGVRDLFFDEIYTDPDSIFSVDIEQITLPPTNSDTIFVRVDTTKIDSVIEFGSLNLIRVISPTEVDTITTKLQVLFQKAIAKFEIDELAFDTTQAASKKRLAFFIKNTEGNANLRIDSIKITGRDTSAFSIVSFSKITNAGDSTKIYIDFFPAKLDSNFAELTLYTNSYPFSVFNFPLSGVGKGGEISDDTFDRLSALSAETFETFGNNELEFFIKNTGSDNVKVSVTFWEKYFRVTNEQSSNIIVEPDDSIGFTVQYLTPNFDVENIDTMKIWHNGFGDSPIKVVLTGSFDSLKSTQLIKDNLKVNNSNFVEDSYLFPEKTSIQFILNSELMENYDNLKFKINYFTGGPGFRKTASDVGDNRSVIPYNNIDDRGLIFAGQLDTKDSRGITVDSVKVFDYLDAQIIVGNFKTPTVVVPRSFVSSEPEKSDVKWTFFGFPFGDVVFDSLFLNLGGRENMTDGEWMVYQYDANSSNSYSQFDNYYVEPNKGYFIAQSLENNLRFKYEYKNDFITRKLKDSLFTLDGEGWKTVASPFTFPVEVDTPVTLLKWDTNNKSWRATSIMRPGEAYFVEPEYNELKLKAYGEYYPDLFPKILSPNGWGAKIKIAGRKSECELFVGRKSDAVNETEITAGPRIQKGLRAYISNESGNKLLLNAKSFNDGAIWELNLLNNLSDDYATISIERFGDEQENYSAVFYAAAENKIIPNGSIVRLTKGAAQKIKLIAGTDEFIERTIDEMVLATPKQFALFNNYPNPFNPSTVIKYSIPENGFVELKIFDILGRELRTLVSENKNAGTYQTQFNAEGLASGIYFYKLQSGGKTAVKKLMLLK
ncbi:MAG: T9SS type A sorting domain-containing protein, partial [Chlorobi bacterium]|nr:T9SS type A sorting domain-containing protein [Chlorobiota bacterium]